MSTLTKEADPSCKKCLGTGKKIKIYKYFGASRELKNIESLRQSEASLTISPKIFYIKGTHFVEKDDLIIDSESIYKIFSSQRHRGEKGAGAFTRIICPDKKIYRPEIIKNFKELLNEHSLRK